MDLPLPDAALTDSVPQRQTDTRRFRIALLVSGLFVALLWWIKLVETWLGHSLENLALRPLEPSGLIGVLLAPLLHGSAEHLLANTLPLLILGTLAQVLYPKAVGRALPLIWLGSGLLVWLIGRPSLHLGASGLSHGLMFFVFVAGMLRRDRAAIAGGLIAFFLYGGMLLTILPQAPDISWESHLGGALFGILSAAIWRRLDPLPPRKRYSWELEEESEKEPARFEYEPPVPKNVPVLWQRFPADAVRSRVISFPAHRALNATQETLPELPELKHPNLDRGKNHCKP